MEAATNALFDELVSLLDNDYEHLCLRIDLQCNLKVAEILQEEEDRLGGMPMSGIMWDQVDKLIRIQRSKSEQKKERAYQHMKNHAQKCFEWWVLAGPDEVSRLEMSMAAARSWWQINPILSLVVSIADGEKSFGSKSLVHR